MRKPVPVSATLIGFDLKVIYQTGSLNEGGAGEDYKKMSRANNQQTVKTVITATGDITVSFERH